MPVLKRENGDGESKNPAARRAGRNRYYRHSKLSEYTFLKVLRGFADDLTARQCAAGMRVSEKTVRGIFMALRRALLSATLSHPYRFGGAGFFLFRDAALSERGKRILEAVAQSEIFRAHRERHCPRLSVVGDGKHYLFEVTVRIFCNIAVRKDPEHLYPPDTRTAIAQMQSIADWIRQTRDSEGFYEKYGHVVARFGKAVEAMSPILERDELRTLQTKSAPHQYPNRILYEHLRRYLRKNPL